MLLRVSCWRNRIINVSTSQCGAWQHSTAHITGLHGASKRSSRLPRSFSVCWRSSSAVAEGSESRKDFDRYGNETAGPSATPLPPLASLLSPPNQLHSSLSTFLDHAYRVRLKPTTQVFVGTRYEYLTQETLAGYGFELLRTGKAGDRGVDLAGWWHLPQPTETGEPTKTLPSRVLVQCKRLKGKRGLTPAAVRELEGAFLGAPAGWRSDEVLGVMVSTRPATKGVITALSASKKGLVWVCLEEHENNQALKSSDSEKANDLDSSPDSPTSDTAIDDQAGSSAADTDNTAVYQQVNGRVIQLLYNQSARRMVLEGLDVIARHNDEVVDSSERNEITLIYRGRPIPGVSGEP